MLHGQTETVNDAQGPSALFKTLVRREVVELVLEVVHPGNLGALPPSPDVLAYKAIQLLLVRNYQEATTKVCVWRKHWDADAQAKADAMLRDFYNFV